MLDIFYSTIFSKITFKNFFFKYAFISYKYKILSKLKKIESVGTSPMDWFYKEKQKRGDETITHVTNSGICKSNSVDFFTQMRRW